MDRPTYQQILLQTAAYRGIREASTGVLAKYGLNTAQWLILGLVNNEVGDGLRITDIGKALRVENPLVTNLVHELVESNLLKTSPHRRDKRSKILSLTAKGRRLIEKIEPEIAKILAPIKACASPADWETYFATLEKIISATNPDS